MRRPPPTEQPCDGEDSVLAGSGRVVPQPGLPAPFFPHNGSYRANPSRRHPPALIAQPQGDDFVPPTVAENYVKALREVSCHDTCITGICVGLPYSQYASDIVVADRRISPADTSRCRPRAASRRTSRAWTTPGATCSSRRWWRRRWSSSARRRGSRSMSASPAAASLRANVAFVLYWDPLQAFSFVEDGREI